VAADHAGEGEDERADEGEIARTFVPLFCVGYGV